MTDGGKGSKPRPYSVTQDKFSDNWDKIFKNEYQDELSTEDCILDAFEEKKETKRDQFNGKTTDFQSVVISSILISRSKICGISLMVERNLAKVQTPVRFWYSAPNPGCRITDNTRDF